MSENPMDALRVMSPDAVSKAEMFGQQFTEMLRGVENGTGTMDFSKVQAMVSNLRGVGAAPQPSAQPRTLRVPNGQVGQEPKAGGPSPEQMEALKALMGAGGAPGGAGGAGAQQAIMQALMQAGGDPRKAEAILRRQAQANAARNGGGKGAPAPARGAKTAPKQPPVAAEPTIESLEAPVYEGASEVGGGIEAILNERFQYYMDNGVNIQVLQAISRDRADVSVVATDPRSDQQVLLAERLGVYPEDIGKALRSVIVRAHRNLVNIYGPPPEGAEDDDEGEEYDDEAEYDLEDEG